MREDVLLSNITFEGVRVCFERSVCPSLCFAARLIELLNRVGLSSRLAGEVLEPLSSLAAVRSCPLSAACAALRSLSFSPSASPGPSLLLSFCFLFFLIFDETSQKLFQVSFFPPEQDAF